MSLARDVPAVMGDRIQLQQVLLNLILNVADAVREVPPHRRRLLVRSTAEDRDDGPWAVVAVEDAGWATANPGHGATFRFALPGIR